MPKTWQQKFDSAKPTHVKELGTAFASIPAGAKLLIPSPALVDEYVRDIKRGKTVEIAKMRDDLAQRYKADATCPVTSSIFLRIVAELALESIAAGKVISRATPFWRIIPPDGPIAKKLSCGPDFIVTQRALEAA
jgi:hypothetical protein